MSKTQNENITMEQYIGKKKGVEILGHIIGILLIISAVAGIVLTIIALVSGGKNDTWDFATISYYLIFMLGIVYLFFVFSGRFKRRKEYKKSIKKLTERNLLELARQEFAPAKSSALTSKSSVTLPAVRSCFCLTRKLSKRAVSTVNKLTGRKIPQSGTLGPQSQPNIQCAFLK